MDTTQPYLLPIEYPKGWLLKLLYALTRRQFGKVIMPMKVVGTRMPLAFSQFGFRIYQLDKKLTLPPDLVLLIRQKVAQVNVCEFCMDTSRFKAMQGIVKPNKLDALHNFSESSLFSEAEKAALDYATELTATKKMRSETFERLKPHFPERQICEIVYLVASEHFSNLSNIGLNIHSDQLCTLPKKV